MDTYSSIKSKRNRTAPALKVLKRASKSYEALQQGFLLTLLNKSGFGLVIKKPERRSVKTIQSLVITSLIHPNGQEFQYEIELENVCNQLAMTELQKANYFRLTPQNIDSIAEINKIISDGYDIEVLKQIKRHKEANRNSIAFNWLVKYAEDIGYKFGKRISKPAQYTTKMIKIQTLQNETGKIEMNQDVIEYVGMKFNKHVFDQFEKVESHLIINRNDPQVVGILNTISEVKGTLLKSMYENDLNEANGMSVSQYLNNNSTQINENESEMKSDEIETNEIKAKTVTTMNCIEQQTDINPTETKLNQSNEMNQITNTVFMEEYDTNGNNENISSQELPDIENHQIEVNQNENNEIDICARSMINENTYDIVDKETYNYISEYYQRISQDPFGCFSFVSNCDYE